MGWQVMEHEPFTPVGFFCSSLKVPLGRTRFLPTNEMKFSGFQMKLKRASELFRNNLIHEGGLGTCRCFVLPVQTPELTLGFTA